MSSTLPVSSFLRRVLQADAVLSFATGALMAVAATPLGPLLGLPVPLLSWAGIICIGFAVAVGWMSSRAELPRAAVMTIVVLNALWVVESVLLLLSGWVSPTTLGIAFVLFQAAVVAVLAELQFIGQRRARHAMA